MTGGTAPPPATPSPTVVMASAAIAIRSHPSSPLWPPSAAHMRPAVREGDGLSLEFMATITDFLDLSKSMRAMLSKIFLSCGWMALGSVAWPRISSRLGSDTK